MTDKNKLLRLQGDIEEIRNRRIRQFVYVCIALLSTLSVINVFTLQSTIMYIMMACVLILCGALYLLQQGRTALASQIVLAVTFFCICQSMWEGSGLRSAGVLGFPAVLLLAMIMVGLRSFYVIYAGMMIFIVALSFATLNGWREGDEIMRGYLTTLDYMVVLSAATFVIRVLASDLLLLLERLRREVVVVEQSKLAAEHLANHDNLTGLPNRRMAEQLFADVIGQSQTDDTSVGFVFVDVDNFKQINDSMGHARGDALLQHITETITQQLRRSDKLVRIAGDEFLILVGGLRATDDLKRVLDKIIQAVATSVVLDGVSIKPSISMGVAIAPEDGDDFSSLLHHADVAMYQAKAAGRGRYEFYRAPVPVVD
jgi:diguanylate cyclase